MLHRALLQMCQSHLTLFNPSCLFLQHVHCPSFLFWNPCALKWSYDSLFIHCELPSTISGEGILLSNLTELFLWRCVSVHKWRGRHALHFSSIKTGFLCSSADVPKHKNPDHGAGWVFSVCVCVFFFFFFFYFFKTDVASDDTESRACGPSGMSV